eukprot:6198572-Pleurochrysis_carterae.AAC.2
MSTRTRARAHTRTRARAHAHAHAHMRAKSPLRKRTRRAAWRQLLHTRGHPEPRHFLYGMHSEFGDPCVHLEHLGEAEGDGDGGCELELERGDDSQVG